MKMDTKYLWKHVIKMDETLNSQSSSLTKDDLVGILFDSCRVHPVTVIGTGQ